MAVLVPGVGASSGCRFWERRELGTARGNVQRVGRTATVVNILSSVAEVGGFLDSTVVLGLDATGGEDFFRMACGFYSSVGTEWREMLRSFSRAAFRSLAFQFLCLKLLPELKAPLLVGGAERRGSVQFLSQKKAERR